MQKANTVKIMQNNYKNGDLVELIDGSNIPSTKVYWNSYLKERVGNQFSVINISNEILDLGPFWADIKWVKPVDVTLHVPGAKDDNSKPPVALVFESFPRALIEVAKVAGYGEKKYTRGGWISVEDGINRYLAAAGRHELKRYIEGEYDISDSNLWHLAHQAWNIMAVLELKLREKTNV
jgi:hypothetical protein